MPRAQKSTLGPCPVLSTTSGGTYSAVPQKLNVFVETFKKNVNACIKFGNFDIPLGYIN